MRLRSRKLAGHIAVRATAFKRTALVPIVASPLPGGAPHSSGPGRLPGEGRSRRLVGRVLCPPVSGRRRPFVWDIRRRMPRATNPSGSAEAADRGGAAPVRRSYSVLLPVGFTLPAPSPEPRGALTAPFHPCRPGAGRPPRRRFVFCGTFPGVAPAGRYPAPFLRGARTFLTGRETRRGRPAF